VSGRNGGYSSELLVYALHRFNLAGLHRAISEGHKQHYVPNRLLKFRLELPLLLDRIKSQYLEVIGGAAGSALDVLAQNLRRDKWNEVERKEFSDALLMVRLLRAASGALKLTGGHLPSQCADAPRPNRSIM
jgi:hypothetical protein